MNPRCRGLQCSVALPKAHEECAPAFVHTGVAELPFVDSGGTSARIVAGNFSRPDIAREDPVAFVFRRPEPGARVEVPPDYTERALYIVEGRILARTGCSTRANCSF